ncbi:MAG: amidohydrolase [Deltaproteobacteria bacterium]|nr:amidohydrolase [Deltaproteobacteria bacterium]
MIIDWEHHFLPERLWQKKGGKKGERAIFYEHGKPRGSLHPELCDPEEHLRIMDAVGIDMAVLSMAVSNADPRIAMEECRVWDDEVAKLVKKYPRRFVGLAPVPPLGGAEAFAELDRAVKDLGLKGVVIRSQANGHSMDARELYPFYERVLKLDVPVFIHPSGVQLGMSILDAPYDMCRSVGRELDLMVATTRIILSGVLDDFPGLKLVISHKGGGIAALKERIEYQFGSSQAPGTRPEGTCNREPFDVHFNKMYFNLAGHHGGMNSVRCALTTIRPNRLVFGTDYPQEFSGDPLNIKNFIENIRKLELDEKSKDLMLGGNARELLKLN